MWNRTTGPSKVGKLSYKHEHGSTRKFSAILHGEVITQGQDD